MLPEQFIRFVVACGEFDSRSRRTGFKQGAYGIGRAALGPVGIDASFDGELERCAALGIDGVDWRSACDQFLDDFGPGAPRRDMQSRAILRDTKIPIAFAIEGCGAHTQVEKIADTREVPPA